MKFSFLFIILITAISYSSCSAFPLLQTPKSSSTKKNSPTASQALQDALLKGSNSATTNASKYNGFYGNPLIKIPFPKEAQSVASSLQSIGLGNLVNQAVESINRSAEEASKDALPILKEAILNINFSNALQIITGAPNSATKYLQTNTTSKLISKFTPVVKKALAKTQATKYWKDVISTYNKIPGKKKINPDLEQYVVQETLSGLFTLISKEEVAIRKDPLQWTTNAMKIFFPKQ